MTWCIFIAMIVIYFIIYCFDAADADRGFDE